METIEALRQITSAHQRGWVKCPKTGRRCAVDAFSASAVVGVYDRLKPENQAKLAAMALPAMISIAFKLLK